MSKVKINYNAPLTLTYALICTSVFILNHLTRTENQPNSGWLDPFFTLHGQYSSTFGFFTGCLLYIFNHASWGHLIGNMTLILLLGPVLEERHGMKSLLIMIVITTLITAVLNVMFFDNGIYGASGIDFLFIILISFANVKEGSIPLTFILVFILYVGKEIYESTQDNNVSEFAHILGGISGSIFGLIKVFGWDKKSNDSAMTDL